MNASHYQLNDHPLHQAIYDLCQQIEKCGASTELTKAVTMASGLQRGVAALREEVEKAKRMNRENYDAGNAYMEISTKVRGDCDTLRTQLTAAEARCKELEADKGRLDWLEKNGTVAAVYQNTPPASDHTGPPFWKINWMGDETTPTLRAAIDAARQPPTP